MGYRDEMLTEANAKKAMALKAHKAGDMTLCKSFLRQAADRYRAARKTAWATWCENRINVPVITDIDSSPAV